MTKKLRDMLQKKASMVSEAKALLDSNQEGQMSNEDVGKYDNLMASIEAINASIKREEAIEREMETLGVLEVQAPSSISGGVPGIESDPLCGFSHSGELLLMAQRAAKAAATSTRFYDERLQILSAAPSSAASGASGQDGGYLLPIGFSKEIIKAVEAPDTLYSMTNQIQIEGYSQKFPVDETTPWQTTSGIRAFWDGELSQIQQVKPVFQNMEIQTSRLSVLAPVSNELLDAPVAMGSYINSKVMEVMPFKVDASLIEGDGVGQPLGILSSGALKSVAKESGQAADTLLRLNIHKIWGGMRDKNRMKAVWICNQDIETQLQELQFVGTESPVPLYLPSGGLSASPYSTLKGRPVIYHEAAKTLGDQGDIILVDLSQYATVKRGDGVKSDSSIHFFYDYYATAFRFVMFVGGRPWLSAPIAAKNGSATYSTMVTLDERA